MKWFVAILALAVFAVPAFSEALNISNIELFAYYHAGSSLNLTTALTGCNTTQQTNISKGYIECTVKLDVTRMGGRRMYSSPYPNDNYYSQIHVRVRSDGWIMAWMLKGDFPRRSGYIYWDKSDSYCTASFPGANLSVSDTTLGAAINSMANTLGVSYSRSSVNYYDYDRNASRGFVIFGYGQCEETHCQQSNSLANYTYYYYSLPSNLVGETVELSSCIANSLNCMYNGQTAHYYLNTSSGQWIGFYEGNTWDNNFFPSNLTAYPGVNLASGVLNGFGNGQCLHPSYLGQNSASAIILYYHSA